MRSRKRIHNRLRHLRRRRSIRWIVEVQQENSHRKIVQAAKAILPALFSLSEAVNKERNTMNQIHGSQAARH
jgi:hypothetical protein